MNTLQIIDRFVALSKQNTDYLSQIPWEDLNLCVFLDLEGKKYLYPDSQYESVCQKFFSLLKKAEASASCEEAISNLTVLRKSLELLPDAEYASSVTEEYFYNAALLRHIRNRTIPVIGDSHVNFFSGNEELSFRPIGKEINTCRFLGNDLPFTPLHLGPCLAYNCMQPDSSTGFFSKLQFLCDQFIIPGSKLIIVLGEVDLRAHVFKHLEKENDYRSVVDTILVRFYPLLKWLKKRSYQVACWGPIATQPDQCPVTDTYPRIGSEVQRNQATAYFNDRLKEHCETNDYGFLSVFYDMIDDHYHTRIEYLSPDLCHLSQRAIPLAQKQWDKL